MSELLDGLNDAQRSAVTHGAGPLLIVAGAGTGKTTVIAKRIANLILSGQAGSDEVLALTFTEKAAGEMETRLDELLPYGYVDLWISTFHGFGERLLERHGLDIGLNPGGRLLNEFEQWALIRRHLDEFALDYYRPRGNPTKFIGALVKHFSRLKDENVSPAEYLEYADGLKQNLDNMLSGSKNKSGRKMSNNQDTITKKYPITNNQYPGQEAREQEAARINELANAYHTYDRLLRADGAMDFGDLINETLRLFRERPAILAAYRKQFKYILLDEFQDTNWAQYELIKLLAAPANNLVVVGDDDQAIYKFRGASVANILQFKRDYPGATQVVLTENYRNRQGILDLAYAFIQRNNPNRLECQLNTAPGSRPDPAACALSKALTAKRSGEAVIEVLAGGTQAEEHAAMAAAIIALRSSGQADSWNDIAVLVRANETAREASAALERSGIPVLYLASRGLYAKPSILDVVAWFKLLDSYHENQAVYRVLTLPCFGFTSKELSDLTFAAQKKAWSLFTALKDAPKAPATAAKAEKLLALVERHSRLAKERSALELLLVFLHESGYLAGIQALPEPEARERYALLNQFARRIERFEQGSDDKGVRAFLAELTLEIDAGEAGALAPDPDAGPEAVRVMTVHASKGLEFKHVFLPGLVDKRFPTIERKEPIPVPDALVKETLPEGDIHLEEERRLFYVAMTRAADSLRFSWAPDYGGTRKKKPSRFLQELGLPLGESVAAADVNGRLTPAEKPDAPAAAGAEPPAYFSFSKLTAFLTCPYQYRFSYILKVPTRNKHYFSFGKTMHATLQRLFELVRERRSLNQGSLFTASEANAADPAAVTVPPADALALFESAWVDDWYESAAQKEEYRAKGKEILLAFLEAHNGRWPATRSLEQGFKSRLQDGPLRYTIGGTIDRIDEADGQLHIIDYKTGAPKEKLDFDEKLQLLIYQLAARELFREPVGSLTFWYLENNTPVSFLGTDAELEKVQEKVIGTIREIRQGVFEPRPSQLCAFCDFFDICEFRQG